MALACCRRYTPSTHRLAATNKLISDSQAQRSAFNTKRALLSMAMAEDRILCSAQVAPYNFQKDRLEDVLELTN